MDKENHPKTLLQAVRYFSDLNICHSYMCGIKWPDGVVTCPRCAGNDIGFIASRRMFQCKECRKQFSVKVGTIFEDSPLGLDKWFVAVWCITNAKNGISSCELARAIGITQKSAWHMLHRIRCAMQSGTFEKLGGPGSAGVEADESFIGGKGWNMHASKKPDGRGPVGKAIVMGVMERKSDGKKKQVRAKVVPNRDADCLHGVIHENVEPGTPVYTDSLNAYRGLAPTFQHQMVDHAEAYVQGVVHTNGLENFWALFKRCLKGTYVHAEPRHLNRYVDEEMFRFNERELSDAGRFRTVMPGVVGRRLMYKTLIGR